MVFGSVSSPNFIPHTHTWRAPGARQERCTGRSSHAPGPSTGDPHHCPHCPTFFTNFLQLRSHCDLLHSGALFMCPHCDSTFGDGDVLRAHCVSAHGDALGREGRRDFDEPPGGGDGHDERDPPARRCQKPFWDWSVTVEYKAAALAVLDDAALGQRRARTLHHDRI